MYVERQIAVSTGCTIPPVGGIIILDYPYGSACCIDITDLENSNFRFALNRRNMHLPKLEGTADSFQYNVGIEAIL